MANIVEQALLDGEPVAFSVPARAKHIIISSNSLAGFFLTLYETDGFGKRFHFPTSFSTPLDIKDYCGDSTQFFITGAEGTAPGEFVSVWVQQ